MTTQLRSDKCLQQSIDDHLVKQAGRCDDDDDDGHLVKQAGQTVCFGANYVEGVNYRSVHKNPLDGVPFQLFRILKKITCPKTYIECVKDHLQISIRVPSLVTCHNHF